MKKEVFIILIFLILISGCTNISKIENDDLIKTTTQSIITVQSNLELSSDFEFASSFNITNSTNYNTELISDFILSTLNIEPELYSLDSDNDGISDMIEISIFKTNPLNADTDNDGLDDVDEEKIGTDPLDPDTDNDGLFDGEEISLAVFQIQQIKRNKNSLVSQVSISQINDEELNLALNTHELSLGNNYGTNPLNPDTDGDGLLDGKEVEIGTNPLDPDSDDDGLLDGEEFGLSLLMIYDNQGVILDTIINSQNNIVSNIENNFIPASGSTNTDPLDPDSDDDGLLDGEEKNIYKTNPNDPDSDDDSWSDGLEIKKYYTNPLNADTDGDGLNDAEELAFARSPLIPEKTLPYINGKLINKTLLAEEIKSYFPLIGEEDNDSDNLLNDEEAWLGNFSESTCTNVGISNEIIGLELDVETEDIETNETTIIDLILNPMEDSSVFAGSSHEDQNYGTSTGLYIRDYNSNKARIFLKFNLSECSSVSSATLYLYTRTLIEGSTEEVKLYSVNSDSWDELTINWNSQPNYLTLLDSSSSGSTSNTVSATSTEGSTSTIGTVGSTSSSTSADSFLAWWSWDATSYVANEAINDKIVSLVLIGPESSSIHNYWSYHSKESAETNFIPYLKLECNKNVNTNTVTTPGTLGITPVTDGTVNNEAVTNLDNSLSTKCIHLITNPLSEDTDGDGLTDDLEILMKTNPLDKDSDSDGLVDSAEIITVFRSSEKYGLGQWVAVDSGKGLKGYGYVKTVSSSSLDCNSITRLFDTPEGYRIYVSDYEPKNNYLEGRVELVNNADLAELSQIEMASNTISSNLLLLNSNLLITGTNIEKTNPFTAKRFDKKTIYIVESKEDACSASNPTINLDSGLSVGNIIVGELIGVENMSVITLASGEAFVYESPLINNNATSSWNASIINYPVKKFSGHEVYINYTNPLNNDSDNDGLIDSQELEVIYRTTAQEGNYGLFTWISFGFRKLETYVYDSEIIIAREDDITFLIETPEGYPLYQRGNDLFLFKEIGQPNLNGDTFLKYVLDNELDNITKTFLESRYPSLNYPKQELYIDITNPLNADTDNDGIIDGEELGLKTNPLKIDSDNDGLGDGYELIKFTDPTNPDTDGDLLLDGIELSIGLSPLKIDSDNDGLNDYDEYIVLNSNPKVNDSDADGLLDGFENKIGTNMMHPDTDGDGITDYDEIYVTFTSPLNADTDGDGLIDGDEDKNKDGIINLPVSCVGLTLAQSNNYETDPLNPDTDNDGITDGQEVAERLYPQCNDTDGDGLFDGDEYNIGTDPDDADSDNDLYCANSTNPECAPSNPIIFPSTVSNCYGYDGEEISYNLDPTIRNSISTDIYDPNVNIEGDEYDPYDGETICRNLLPYLDPDNDGLNNSFERSIGTNILSRDTDGDNVFDNVEILQLTSPLNADTDGDGLNDGLDLSPRDAITANEVTWLSAFPAYTVDTQAKIRILTLPDSGVSSHIFLTKHHYWFCVSDGTTEKNLGRTFMILGEPEKNEMLKDIDKSFYANSGYTIKDYSSSSNNYMEYIQTFGSGSCIHRNVFDFNFESRRTDFKFNLTNNEITNQLDSSSSKFRILHESFKPVKGYDQELLLQYSFITPVDDLTLKSDLLNRDAVFSIKLFKAVSCPSNEYSDYGTTPCLESYYETSAPSINLGDGNYQVKLPILKEYTNEDTIYLQIKPFWLERKDGIYSQKALDPTTFILASFSNTVFYDSLGIFIGCEDVSDECEEKMENIVNNLPNNISSFNQGNYEFINEADEKTRVTVFTDTFIESRYVNPDAIIIIATSPLRLAEIENAAFYDAPEDYSYEYTDGLNNLTGKHEIKFFKKVTYAYSDLRGSNSDLNKELTPPINTKIRLNVNYDTLIDSFTIVGSGDDVGFKITSIESTIQSGEVLGEGFITSKTSKVSNTGIIENILVKDNFNTFVGLLSEAVDEVPVAGDIGLVVLTDGLDAVMAFKEGDKIKGTLSTVKVGIGLAEIGTEAILLKQGSKFAGKIGPIATAATGIVTSGYDIYLSTKTDDPFEEKKHLESATAGLIDTAFAVVPYGYVIDPSWKLAIAGISHFFPNRLGEKVCSSAGTGITFFTQYSTGDVPSALSEEATLSIGELIMKEVDEENKDALAGKHDLFFMYLPPK
jgi:thrombospondin type 3 repeat protein